MVLTTTRKSGNVPLKTSEKTTLKHKRRFCKVDGCSRIVKSQGVCQRHGAKPRKCRVVDCPKQAQGNYDGMCKAHFRAHKNNELCFEEEPTKITSTTPYCQPVLVPQDSSVPEESSRQGPGGEDSIATVHSGEDSNGRDLWDEPYFCANGTRSEELAADLFGVLSEVTPSMACEEWAGGQMSRKEEAMPVARRGHRTTYSISGEIPSCTDYSPNFYASNYQRYPAYEHRDAGNYMSSSSGYMDYYMHENASAREAV